MSSLFQIYRILAAFLIVMIHQQFWKLCSFVGGLENCAAPLFACMAGYLYKGSLAQNVPRVIVPHFIWAAIYFLANSVVLDVIVKRSTFEFPVLKSWLPSAHSAPPCEGEGSFARGGAECAEM